MALGVRAPRLSSSGRAVACVLLDGSWPRATGWGCCTGVCLQGSGSTHVSRGLAGGSSTGLQSALVSRCFHFKAGDLSVQPGLARALVGSVLCVHCFGTQGTAATVVT